jgi:hypothetical protein
LPHGTSASVGATNTTFSCFKKGEKAGLGFLNRQNILCAVWSWKPMQRQIFDEAMRSGWQGLPRGCSFRIQALKRPHRYTIIGMTSSSFVTVLIYVSLVSVLPPLKQSKLAKRTKNSVVEIRSFGYP